MTSIRSDHTSRTCSLILLQWLSGIFITGYPLGRGIYHLIPYASLLWLVASAALTGWNSGTVP